MEINLEYFKMLYYVGRYGSLTRAAKELHISQPAVSQSIKNLEDALGQQIFVRSKKGVTLTKEGQTLYEYVARGYEEMQEGVRKLHMLKNLDSGELKIGASDMTLRFYLLPYLETFRQQYTKIKVSVTNAPTPRTIENLLNGEIDFGVVSSPVDDIPNIKTIAVQEIQDIFIVGDRYKELSEKEISLNDIGDIPYLSLEGRTASQSYIDDLLRGMGINLTPELSLATSDMIVSFVERGFGLATVVNNFAEEKLAEGKIYKVITKEVIPPRQILVAYDERRVKTRATAALFEIMGIE